MKRLAMVLMVVLGLFCVGALAVFAQSADTAPTRVGAQTATAQESVPRLVQFTGTLKAAAARPLAGVASVTFAIYADQDGGTPLWNETQNVLADGSGHFNVLLGSATAAGVPTELFGTGQSRWLGVTIARQPEMSRILLASVPYALKAADAETLGGLPASAYVTTQSLAARATTPGGTTILTTPQISAHPNAAASTAFSDATSAALPQATPTGAGTTNFIPLWTSSSALGNSLLYQTGGKIGVGTTTPTETLDVNGNSIFRGSFQLPPGHDATASAGYESHSFQFQASSYNSSTKASTTQSFGFRAEPLNNNTANPSSQLELFFIPNGGSDFEYTGVSWSSTGIMTFAPGQTFSGASESLTGSLNLPNTTNSTTGVINLGGSPVINNLGSTTNIFVGTGAGGNFTTTGDDNTALGGEAMFSNTTGYGNTGVGFLALYDNTTGFDNTAIGFSAMNGNLSGAGNTAVGFGAGTGTNTGNTNTFLGYYAQGSNNLTNATAIGANAMVGGNNSIVLGSIKGVANAAASAHVGIGTIAPAFPLVVVDDGASGGAIQGYTSVANDSAIFGYSGATTGDSNGAYFYSSSPQGSGVVGVNNNSTGFGGYFVGNVAVTGTLTKGARSFKIDDPIDPANKYLSHSFVESPDMMNIYNGNVVTNAKGYAVVTMPPWFEALNADFRYKLTTVGSLSQATVAREIRKGKFVLLSSKHHVKIPW